MLYRLILHRLIKIIVLRQRLNFKTCWFWTTYLCSLSALISILVILIIDGTVRFLLTVNRIILTYIYGIWIITFCLSLSWMNYPPALYFCFLSGTSPSTANTYWISTIILLWLWVEILSSSRKSWQNILIIIFEWFIYFRNTLISSSLRLKMVHYSLMSISRRSLTTYLILILYSFFMLFDVRTKASAISCFLNFVFDST